MIKCNKEDEQGWQEICSISNEMIVKANEKKWDDVIVLSEYRKNMIENYLNNVGKDNLYVINQLNELISHNNLLMSVARNEKSDISEQMKKIHRLKKTNQQFK